MIYVRHKNELKKFLVCNEDYIPIREEYIERKMPYRKSFYTRFVDGYIGVYSSLQGPVLFVNNKKYLFKDESWGICVKKKNAENKVIFSGLDGEDLVFDSPLVPVDNLNPWSEEGFDDFFLWLESHRYNQEFIRIWTE